LTIFRGLDVDVNDDFFDSAYEQVLSCLWTPKRNKVVLWNRENQEKIRIPLGSSIKILFIYSQDRGLGV